MTNDYEDLILRLYHSTECMAHLPCSDMELWNEHSNAVLKSADALKELVAERDRWKENFSKAQERERIEWARAERAEADLAAARAALLWAYEELPISCAMADVEEHNRHQAAIAAARAEKGGE